MRTTPRTPASAGRAVLLVITVSLAACDEEPAVAGDPATCEPGEDPVAAADYLPPTRLLRRISLALTGRAPVAADYQALLDAADDAERQAIIDELIDDALAAPTFYDVMRQVGHEWVPILPVANVGDVPGYVAGQQANIGPCPEGTPHAGALTLYNKDLPGIPPCSGTLANGEPAPVEDVEPWWAPGTTVRVVGYPANDAPTSTVDGVTYDCASRGPDYYGAPISECGCGPNLVWCHPSLAQGWANYAIYAIENAQAQRRLLWEEPARLIAHVAWHDRPLSDIILGDYSVGPVELQAAYVRAGRVGGASELDQDRSWWSPELFSGAVDPLHDDSDPWAWREFTVADRNPYLLSERDYRFDPRSEPRNSMRGTPAAGILTMIGVNDALPRERVRAARALEWFACDNFVPPSADQTFNAFERDPATEGPCQACHARLDPAAIHFKRWQLSLFYPLAYRMLGVAKWTYPDAWTTGTGPFNYQPFARIARAWLPDTVMTPVTEAESDANAETRYIDFLPPGQTLFGQTSDGTVGPLGFAKMLVASGEFDKCMVRKLHARFGGRPLDPATEHGYIEELAAIFVANDRKVRPFLKELMRTELFRRGL